MSARSLALLSCLVAQVGAAAAPAAATAAATSANSPAAPPSLPPPLAWPAPDGPPLTLTAALAVARERVLQGQNGISRAWAAFSPILGASAAYTRNSIGSSIQQGGQTVTTQAEDAVAASVTGSWSVFDYRRYPALDNAKDQGEVSRLGETQVRRELLLNVAAVYLLGVQTRKLAEAAYALSDSRREQARQAQARYSAGVLQRASLVRAQLDVVRADQQARKSYYDFLAAKSQLAQLLNRRDSAFELVEPQTPPPELQGEFNELLQRAMNDRPEIAAARLNQQIAARLSTDAWAQFLPKLDLSGRASYANAVALSGSNTAWAITLGLTVPLYDGGFRYVQLREAESKKRETRAQTDGQVARIEDELRRAQLDLRSARLLLESAGKALELAQENDGLIRAQFEAGTATQIEVSDATANVFQSEADLLREKLSVQLSSLRLAKAVGAFDP